MAEKLVYGIAKIEVGTPTGLATMPTALTPPTAPTAGTPTAGGSVTAGTHTYKVTFVNATGESLPSVASSSITAVTTTGQTVPLTDIATGPTGTVSRKIYRTVAGNTGNYKLLTTIADNTTVIFSDTIADGSLGADAPTVDTSGLRRFAGTVKGSFSFSETESSSVTADVEEEELPLETITSENAKLEGVWKIFDNTPSTLMLLMGGTVDGEIWHAAAVKPEVRLALKITTTAGPVKNIYKTKITARETGVLSKEGFKQIEVKFSALSPGAGLSGHNWDNAPA